MVCGAFCVYIAESPSAAMHAQVDSRYRLRVFLLARTLCVCVCDVLGYNSFNPRVIIIELLQIEILNSDSRATHARRRIALALTLRAAG